MATAKSIMHGVGVAATGAAIGYLGGNAAEYMSHLSSFSHLNATWEYASYAARALGFVGMPLLGAYHAFFSEDANPQPNPPANGPQDGRRGRGNVTINVRGGRNTFRL